MTDWGALYRDNLAAVAVLAPGLSEEQVATRVPATPAWTVHDVLAHLAGGPADYLADRMDDAPSPAWSARHVEERSGRSVAELVAEMQANADAVVAKLAEEPRPALVWDLAVHHADLREALGLPMAPAALWDPIVAVAAPMMLASQVGKVAELPAYELFRGLFSRRSRAQMTAWRLPVDPEALDNMCIFGPRTDDQPLPPAVR